MPRPKYAGKRKSPSSAFAASAAAKRYRARSKTGARLASRKARARVTRSRGRVRRVKRVFSSRPSAVATALSVVAPVKWINQQSWTSNYNLIPNAQNVRLTEQLNSRADLATILGQHGLSTDLGLTAPPNATQKCYVMSSKCTFRVTNFDINDSHFQIYRFKPRLGMNSATNFGDPITAWGYVDDGQFETGSTLVPAATTDPYTTYGARPQDYFQLKRFFKIKKMAEFDCPTGMTKEFVFHGNKRPFSFSMTDLTGGAGVGMHAKTVMFVVIGYTCPMISVTNQVVAVSSGKFGVMSSEEYVSKMINYTPALNIRTNNVTIPTGSLRFASDALDAAAADAAP